jgi:hypothetical protein
MYTNPATESAPLVVRLRDLAPHLSHASRARLALDRIQQRADQELATDQFLALASGPAIPEFTRTAEVTMQEWTDRLLALGVLTDPYVPPARRTSRIRRNLRLLINEHR